MQKCIKCWYQRVTRISASVEKNPIEFTSSIYRLHSLLSNYVVSFSFRLFFSYVGTGSPSEMSSSHLDFLHKHNSCIRITLKMSIRSSYIGRALYTVAGATGMDSLEEISEGLEGGRTGDAKKGCGLWWVVV